MNGRDLVVSGHNSPVGLVECLDGYQCIYADPPWGYDQGGRGSIEGKYEGMPIDEIKALQVARLASKDAVLFMWGTWPFLPEVLETMARWGFSYKTVAFVWVKYHDPSGKRCVGGGFWTRANTEFCLLGVRGNPPRRVNKAVRQLIETADEDKVLLAPRGEHSAKPPEARERIVELMGNDLWRIELFARERTSGWAVWGNDPKLNGSDVDLLDVTGIDRLEERFDIERELENERERDNERESENERERDNERESENERERESESEAGSSPTEVDHQGASEMSNVPGDVLNQVGNARVAGGGVYINHGDYVFAVKKWHFQQIQDRVIILELIPVEARKKKVFEGDKLVEQDPNEPGSECSSAANFDGASKQSAGSNSRAPVLALFGFKENEVPQAKVMETLDACCGPDQPAAMMLLSCSTYPKEIRSKKGEYITGLNWDCVAKPGTGVNAPEFVAARKAAFVQGAAALVKLATEQLKAARASGSAPALASTDAGTAPAIPSSAPSIPIGAPAALAPPIVVKDPFAGWTQHPDSPDHMYRGNEYKLKSELLAAAGA